MKPQEFLRENEFIGDDAHQMHKSHQLHMLREECYHSAANAIKLHKLLGELPEGHDLDAWAAEKISLANDYLKTVTEWLEYDVMGGTNEAMMAGGMEAFSMESAERQYAELLGEDQGVAEGSVTPDVNVNKVHDDGHEKEWHIYRGKEMIGYVILNQDDTAEGLYIAYSHLPGRPFVEEFTGLKSAVNYIASLKEGVAEGSKRLPDIRQFDKTVLDKQFGGSMVKMAQALKDAGFSNERIVQKMNDFKQGVSEDAIRSLRRAAGLTENVLRDSTGSTLDHIADKYKRDIKDFEATGNLSDDLFDALYDYYQDDMPYGVQKARSGDPHEWIADRITQDLGLESTSLSPWEQFKLRNNAARSKAGMEPNPDFQEEREPHSVDGGMDNALLYDDAVCNMSETGEHCPVHGVQECWGSMANEDDEKNSSVMPALAGAAAGGAAGYALGSGALNSGGSSVPSAPISPPVMVEKDMDRMKKLAGIKTTDENIMAPIVGGLGGAALGGEIGKNIGSQFGSDVGTAIGKAAGQEQAGTLGSIVGGLKGGSAGSSAGGQAGAKIGQAVGGVAGLAGGAALDSASNKSKTNETELGTGIGAGIGGALGGLGGAALGGIAGHYYSEKNKGAEETDEGWKGQLAGGTVGTLAGGALGAAGGPIGAAVGGALGGTAGQMLGDKLGGQETDEGETSNIAKSIMGLFAPGLAQPAAGMGGKLAAESESPLKGQYGHSGKMKEVGKDTSWLDRLKELSGMKQS